MTVGHICSRNVDVVRTTDSVQTAAQRMLQRNVGSLIARDGTGEPVGILTDRDLAVKVVAHALDAAETSVGEVMTPHPQVLPEETPVEIALSMMRAGGFRRIPVVDRSGDLVGIVSLDDVMKQVAEEAALISDLIERESPQVLGKKPVAAKK